MRRDSRTSAWRGKMKFTQTTISSVLVAGLIGCGGSATTGSSTNPFTGTYTGSMTLDGGKTGDLSLTVASSGTATGTLDVKASKGRDGGTFTFTVGTINISGSVGPDGTINVTGTDANSGLFNVGGQFSSSGGNVNISAGGTNYTGTVSIARSGGGSVTFLNGSGTNAILSPYPANPFILMSTVGANSAVVAALPGGDNSRAFTFNLGSEAIPGSTVDLSASGNVFRYSEGSSKGWKSISGSMNIVARTGSTFQIQLVNVNMTAETDTSATGTFTVNGTLTK